MVSSYRAIILIAVLCLAASRGLAAECQGHDLFPALKSEAPAAYAAIEAAASAMPFAHGKLFRLSRAGTGSSYVFATLHLSDRRITGFSPRLRAALTDSKIVALESVETGAVLRQAIAKNPAALRHAIVAGDNQRADRLLDKADFAQFKALAARKGVAQSAVHTFKPSALALMLDLPSCAMGSPGAKPYVDELVADIARANKIETIGLETIIEQVEVLNGLPLETERGLLIAVLRQADRGEDVIETMVARYAEGDIGGSLAWLRSAEPLPGIAQAQVPPAFLDRLITVRNKRMRDRALPLLKRGGAFIAVGAAHLPGIEGLLSLFEKDGFEVETIE
ncbi:MAG: TraB/GumN family protein [Pseudomonadota bacterium]|nr:TraB/GumN family protein [Pseudomonadota bacterium]